jgi:RNA polymerase II subunit A C-terminal domain phosphatase SSU72
MRLAVTCAMNQNRSMQVHDLFQRKGIETGSYGTSTVIKLPGESATAPNLYDFSQTYREIYEDLLSKNEAYYRENGLLYLLERNMRIKEKPENFFERGEEFDLVITCEEKVFSTIFNHYSLIKPTGRRRFLMVNFDIKDTQADAIVGANEIYEFVTIVLQHAGDGLEEAVQRALEAYHERKDVPLLFAVVNL